MRIVIDLQGLQSKASSQRGVGRYTENLVKELLQYNQKHEFILALNGGLGQSIEQIRDNFSSYVSKHHIVSWQNHLKTAANASPDSSAVGAAEIIREVFLNSFQPDIIFSTNLQEGSSDSAVTSVRRIPSPALFCTTLHDLVPFHYKEQYLADPVAAQWYYQKVEYAKASDIILTDSHASKNDIVKFLSVDESKISVAYPGYDVSQFNPSPPDREWTENLLTTYGLRKPFILYVGGDDSHKNVERLIAAYLKLPPTLREQTDLVLAGNDFKRGKKHQRRLAEFDLTHSVHTPGFIPDEHLPALFKACRCFVFPSTHEGFGLPALEAMACGAAVIGSDASSVKEVIRTRKALFNPLDEGEIADKLESVLTDESLRQELVTEGLKQARNFSWTNCAKTVVDVFERFDGTIGRKGYSFGDPVEGVIRNVSRILPPLKDTHLIEVAKSVSETFFPIGKRKLYLDISAVIIADDRSGIQRVTRALSQELVNAQIPDLEVEVVYTSPSDLNFYVANNYMRNVFGCHVPPHDAPVEFKPNDILLFLDLHLGVAISHLEYTKNIRDRGVKVYHLIYDILPALRPNDFWLELCEEFTEWLRVVSLSDGAICISRTVADELRDWMHEFGEKRNHPFKCGYFHMGADVANSAPTSGLELSADRVLATLASCASFLVVGTIEPRKAQRQTLAAFEHLWRQGTEVNLVMVGRLGWGMSDFSRTLRNHPELNRRLFWLEGISDEYLEKVYGASLCLIAPSEAEGFGLPLIEAARHKLPIIARDIPVFREVAGTNAHFFPDVTDPIILAETIKDWFSLHKTESYPKSDCLPWQTWKQAAQQLLDVIENDRWLHSFTCQGSLVPGRAENYRSPRLEFDGFGQPERGFVWTDGIKSEISFRWGRPSDGGQLCISYFALGKQHVSLLCNGTEVFNHTMRGTETFLTCNLPPLPAGKNVLTFLLPDARPPDESAAKDQRLLALAIRDLKVFVLEPISSNSIEDHKSQRLGWSGFSRAEKDLRRTNGQDISISFRWMGPTENVRLRILFAAFEEQRVTLSLNRMELCTKTFKGQMSQLICDLPFLTVGYNILTFARPGPRISGKTGGPLLALGIREIEVLT